MAFKGGSLLRATSFKEYLGDEKLKKLINFILVYIANLDIPIKRGTFIEFRNGMLNVSPIGRNCNQSERDEFERYDTDARVREKMVKILQTQFEEYNLTFSIGGQISFDVFPKGWDKTFCLQFVENTSRGKRLWDIQLTKDYRTRSDFARRYPKTSRQIYSWQALSSNIAQILWYQLAGKYFSPRSVDLNNTNHKSQCGLILPLLCLLSEALSQSSNNAVEVETCFAWNSDIFILLCSALYTRRAVYLLPSNVP